MTPQQKAKELIDNFQSRYIIETIYNNRLMYIQEAKKCSIIAVDEILKVNPCNKEHGGLVSTIEYWQSVKSEIEKL